MENLRKQLKKLELNDLKILITQAEKRHNETIITFNEQRNRITEIIKFCIPIIGALVYQITKILDDIKPLNINELIIILITMLILTVVILCYSVYLYLPVELSVSGKQASKLIQSNYTQYCFEKNTQISIIIQLEKAIKNNLINNELRNKKLKKLTLGILLSGCSLLSIYMIFLISNP
jgi:hypothetical protein